MNAQTKTATAAPDFMEAAPVANVAPIAALQAADVMMNDQTVDRFFKMAEIMATSKVTVPKHLQGAVGDCFAVVMQAAQWGMNPFSVAQKTHLVNGTLGYEAQLINAVITTRAPITGRLQYDFFGDWSNVNGKTDNSPDRGVTVWATFKGESEPRILEIGMHQVGTVRNSPMWQADPRQQLAYLAVKRWSRLYCPDVILGVYSADELEPAPEVDVTPQPAAKPHSSSAGLKSALKNRAGKAEAVKPAAAFDAEAALAAIEAAENIEALQAIAAAFPKDLGEPEKSILRGAYTDKKNRANQSGGGNSAQG